MSEQLKEAMSRASVGDVEPTYATALALIREAVGRLGWGTMAYRCETCGFEWRVWLTLGVEGPASLRAAGLYVACPFMVRCPAWPARPDATESERAQLRHLAPCEGRMGHVRFQEDEEFSPELIPDDAPRFVLPYALFGGGEGARLEIPTPALVRARRWHQEREAR